MTSPVKSSRPGPDQLFTPDGLGRRSFEAMGTTVVVLLPRDWLLDGCAVVEGVFAHWSAACTRFDQRSELSRLNAAAGRPWPVSDLLFSVLQVARQAALATDGLFDPTLLRSLEWLGYDRDFDALVGAPPAMVSTSASPQTGGWREMHLDEQDRTAQIPPGVGVDLGGLAKGMAVDAALAELAQHEVTVAAVDAGGDLAVLGLPPAGDTWAIAIDGPERPRTISLAAGALATSSIARRRWLQGSKTRHHLIDPRTGLPSTAPVWSASVAARTCAQAEVAAKVAFLLGPADGSRFLEERNLSGLFIRLDGSELGAGALATP